jgi:hypothetical protein
MSIVQLANKRRVNRITRREMQRRLTCSYSWLRALENGYKGPCVTVWQARYAAALDNAIQHRKERNANCPK